MTPAARALEEILHSSNPAGRLRAEVIRRLTRDGLSRETVLGDLEDLRQELAATSRLEDEETVLLVMDHVVGWCNPTWSLIGLGSSEFERPSLPSR